MYVPAILSGLPRQNIISTAHRYHIFGKSRNIIISSGAQHCIQLRGPYDITSLYVNQKKTIFFKKYFHIIFCGDFRALILGLNKQQAKDAISKNCRQVLIEAHSRRFTQMTIISNIAPVSVSSNESNEISDSDGDIEIIVAKNDESCFEIVDEDTQTSKKAKLM